MTITKAFAAASLIMAAQAAARNTCPPDTLGPHYPWLIDGLVAGDQYAEVYLDVNKDGEPTSCKVGQTNLSPDDQSVACMGFLGEWRMKPTSETGIPLPTSVKRFYLLVGSKHQKAQAASRKTFFAQHPELRPECYPDAD